MKLAMACEVIAGTTMDLTQGEVKGMQNSGMRTNGDNTCAIDHQEMPNAPWGAETMGAKYVCDYWTE